MTKTMTNDDGAMRRQPGCPLCDGPGGRVVWRGAGCRVILPDEPDYPGFVRVVLDDHVAEMTDLLPSVRDALMRIVWEAEACLREVMDPDKVNVASLGNMVAHVHWHVIPRWRDDRHFPGSVWSAPQRQGEALARSAERAARVDTLVQRLQARLAAMPSADAE